MYLIAFTIYWAAHRGFHITADTRPANNKFYYFSGILTLSFFIHNSVLNIMRNQRHPENNVCNEDLTGRRITTSSLV